VKILLHALKIFLTKFVVLFSSVKSELRTEITKLEEANEELQKQVSGLFVGLED
jgi:hypothetical protein